MSTTAKFIGLLVLVALVAAACAAPADPAVAIDRSEQKTASVQESEQAPAGDRDSGRASGDDRPSRNAQNQVSLDKADKSQEDTAKPVTRKIIRNADLRLESGAPEEVQRKITAIAESKKGFVVQSRSDDGIRGQKSVSMTIRIPADKFNESLEEIRKAADRVVVESVTGRDVTEEFIDIEARLKTKKALEERFLEIMKQSRSVQDALNVQRQLANVRGEIERIEGRKRFLENQSSLSTVKVGIKTTTALSGSSSGFFYELKEAVSQGFDAALGFTLYLVTFAIAIIPFLLFIILPIYLLLRYFWRDYKKRRLARKMAKEEVNEEIVE